MATGCPLCHEGDLWVEKSAMSWAVGERGTEAGKGGKGCSHLDQNGAFADVTTSTISGATATLKRRHVCIRSLLR